MEDLGVFVAERVDYPDIAIKLAKRVAGEEGAMGVLVCGTGIGMSIVANKVPGARAAVIHDGFTAKLARQHNNHVVTAKKDICSSSDFTVPKGTSGIIEETVLAGELGVYEKSFNHETPISDVIKDGFEKDAIKKEHKRRVCSLLREV